MDQIKNSSSIKFFFTKRLKIFLTVNFPTLKDLIKSEKAKISEP